MYHENPIEKEILEVLEIHKNRKAIIYYEKDDVIRELTYGDLHNLNLRILRSFEESVQNCPIGLFMVHNPFIPSIITCLQRRRCPFMFIKNDDINKTEFKIILSYNKRVNADCYTLKNTVDLLWEHKLYIYESNLENNQIINSNINYIVKTSGTTGDSKIVKVEHFCIYSNILSLRTRLKITHEDFIYFGTNLTFDPSMIELYLAITTGSCLLIISDEIKKNLSQLYNILFRDCKISFLQMCPSVFLQWTEEEIGFILTKSDLKNLILGGESFPKLLEKYKEKKTKIFNIYGITEVSCWASMEEINFDQEISLGVPLDETILEVRNENGDKILNGEGELYIGSKKRICWVDNEKHPSNIPIFRKTGDLVLIKNNKIFYQSRKDDVFKRFGVWVNPISIENKIFEITQMENKLICTGNKLILFVKLRETNKIIISKICDKLRVKLLHNLEKEYFPDHIEAVLNFPVTNNGKIDRKKLKFLEINRKLFTDEIDVFKNLWKKYLPQTESPNKTFYDLGGTSILRLQFTNEFRELSKNLLPNQFFDYLFTNSYEDVINFIQNYNFKRFINEENPKKKLKSNSGDPTMKIKWSYDLKACVDATPLVVKNKKFVTVGSFSNILIVLNIINGSEISKIIFPNAIENSCISTCSGDEIFVGCYNGFFYCIETDTGNIRWRYKTNDKIKNKSCFINEEEAIVFGSYDKYFYCLETKTGTLLWKTFLNSGITADPLYLTQNESIFVSTINGDCFSLDKNGKILWNIKLQSPIFSSPSNFDSDLKIVVAEVQGNIHCLNCINGEINWDYKLENHIYSPIKTYENVVYFTCHDGFLYGLEMISEKEVKLKFKVQLESPSLSGVEILNIKNKKYLITASINGIIYLIDLCGMRIINTIEMNGEIFSSPVSFIHNKNVYIFIGCRDNNLYCIEIE